MTNVSDDNVEPSVDMISICSLQIICAHVALYGGVVQDVVVIYPSERSMKDRPCYGLDQFFLN